MERLADVLHMDKAQPVKLDWLRRLDGALRRMPGLGVFVFLVMMEHWYSRGDFIVMGIWGVFAAITVLSEFLPKKIT